MNSIKLNNFNKQFFPIVFNRNWDVRLGIKKEYLERCITLAERTLFSESKSHPSINMNNFFPRKTNVIAVCWLIFYTSSLFLINLIITTAIHLRKKQWRKNDQKKSFYSISPPGKILDSYSYLTKNYNGCSICIVGPNSWRKAIFEKKNENKLETMLSINPITWAYNLLFMIKQIKLIDEIVVFDSKKKERSIAGFLYVILKQVMMKKKSQEIADSFEKKSIFVFSSEDISIPLLEILITKGHNVSHHVHGMFLRDNLLVEPPLSEFVIGSGIREKEIFNKYENIKYFCSTPPIQMYNDIIAAKKSSSANIDHDILLIASFELPFIQKSTYSILEKSFKYNFHLKVLLRHHPRVPINSRKKLNNCIPYNTISKNKILTEDISRSKIVICCSVDALIVSLIMKKPTIFLPMVDGDYKYYTKPFIGILPNLWCPDSSEELTNYIQRAWLFDTSDIPDDYQNIIEFLFGSLDMGSFDYAIQNIISYKEN